MPDDLERALYITRTYNDRRVRLVRAVRGSDDISSRQRRDETAVRVNARSFTLDGPADKGIIRSAGRAIRLCVQAHDVPCAGLCRWRIDRKPGDRTLRNSDRYAPFSISGSSTNDSLPGSDTRYDAGRIDTRDRGVIRGPRDRRVRPRIAVRRTCDAAQLVSSIRYQRMLQRINIDPCDRGRLHHDLREARLSADDRTHEHLTRLKEAYRSVFGGVGQIERRREPRSRFLVQRVAGFVFHDRREFQRLTYLRFGGGEFDLDGFD